MTISSISDRFGSIVRVAIILLVAYVGLFIATRTPFWLVTFWLIILEMILIFELIRYIERTKKTFRNFLSFIQQEDYSSLSTLGEKDSEIREGYEFILDKFRNLRIEKERSYQYMQQMIEHVDTALISLDQDQQIKSMNRAAKELLQVPEIRDLQVLEKVDADLYYMIKKIRAGEKEIIRFVRHRKIMKLSVRATEFFLDERSFRIVSLHDIKSELEEQELESWQKLVRVLTHEIMNSTIPITNMINVARGFLVDENNKIRNIPGLSVGEKKDLIESLCTAESRSHGLANFVQTTKSLNRLPEPSFEVIQLKHSVKRLRELFRQDFDAASIQFTADLKPVEISLKADPDLIEQVLINVIRNAIDALKGISEPKIHFETKQISDGRISIRICDNGHGIQAENLDQIFVPFYSTKNEGSGIGLSLSRQIMRLHKGRIDVESEEGKGTCVSLEF